MDFRDYLRLLRRGWPVVVAITLVGVGLSIAFLAVAPRTYVATAVIVVSTQGSESLTDLQQGNIFSQQAVTTYAQVTSSPLVLSPVIDKLGLDETPAQLAETIDVSVRPSTTILQITSTRSDPALAASIANSVAESAIAVIGTLEPGSVGGAALVQLRQIQTAAVPEAAASPRPQIVIALGLILGLAIGLAATLVTAALDTRIQTAADLIGLSESPLLARIPVNRRNKRSPLVLRENTGGRSGEAFRSLRTNLRFLEGGEASSLLVTSPQSGDGTSSIAANLAWALADASFSVVLVDVALRDPRVGILLSAPAGVGLTEVILGKVDLPDAIRPTVHRSLSILGAGAQPSNPSELLGSQEMTEVIQSLEERFDYVIIDAPSVLSFTDAAIVSTVAAGTILVVSEGRTKRDQLSSALGTLANVGVTPLGIVVNRARVTGRGHRASSMSSLRARGRDRETVTAQNDDRSALPVPPTVPETTGAADASGQPRSAGPRES